MRAILFDSSIISFLLILIATAISNDVLQVYGIEEEQETVSKTSMKIPHLSLPNLPHPTSFRIESCI